MNAFLHAVEALRWPLCFVTLIVAAVVAFTVTSERRIRRAYASAGVPYDDAQARWDAHVEAALRAAEEPIWTELAMERLHAELEDEDALRRWLA